MEQLVWKGQIFWEDGSPDFSMTKQMCAKK